MTKSVFYENELKTAFSAALECKMTRENASEHTKVYNALYTAGLAFLEKSALLCKGTQSMLYSVGIDTAIAARECAVHIFWNRLDYILSIDANGIIPLVVTMAKRKVSDIFEKECALYKRLDDTDEYGWSIINDGSDIESDFITREGALHAIRSLLENRNKLEAVSFLATKLLGIKTGMLSRLLLSEKCDKTVMYILTESARMLSLGKNFFSNASFFNTEFDISDMSEKELAKEISHASDRAKNKLRKVL